MTDTLVSSPGPVPTRNRPSGRVRGDSSGRLPLTLTSGLGLGAALVWFSILVLLPLGAAVLGGHQLGFGAGYA